MPQKNLLSAVKFTKIWVANKSFFLFHQTNNPNCLENGWGYFELTWLSFILDNQDFEASNWGYLAFLACQEGAASVLIAGAG